MEQHLELESLGILRQTKIPADLAWMSDAEKQCMLLVMLSGAEGMHKTQVAKFEKKNPDVVLKLTIRDMLEWQTNKQGKPSHLALTWKGEEVAQLLLQVARRESQKPGEHK